MDIDTLFKTDSSFTLIKALSMPGILMEAFLRVEVAGIVVTVDEKTTGRLLYKMHFVFFSKEFTINRNVFNQKKAAEFAAFFNL